MKARWCGPGGGGGRAETDLASARLVVASCSKDPHEALTTINRGRTVEECHTHPGEDHEAAGRRGDGATGSPFPLARGCPPGKLSVEVVQSVGEFS